MWIEGDADDLFDFIEGLKLENCRLRERLEFAEAREEMLNRENSAMAEEIVEIAPIEHDNRFLEL